MFPSPCVLVPCAAPYDVIKRIQHRKLNHVFFKKLSNKPIQNTMIELFKEEVQIAEAMKVRDVFKVCVW